MKFLPNPGVTLIVYTLYTMNGVTYTHEESIVFSLWKDAAQPADKEKERRTSRVCGGNTSGLRNLALSRKENVDHGLSKRGTDSLCRQLCARVWQPAEVLTKCTAKICDILSREKTR